MIVTFYSFVMATVMGSIFILIYTILKRRLLFILSFGPRTLLFLAILCFLRIVLPIELPEYQHVIKIKFKYFPDSWIIFLQELLEFFILIIIIGSVFFLIQMIYSQYKLAHYLNSLPVKVNPLAIELLSKIDTSHRIQFQQVSGISVPMVVGLLRPTIYLPDISYSEQQLKYIILHEYTHWKNKDLWIKLFIYTILVLFWWNPFVHLLLKNLDETLELKCDYTITCNFDMNERILYLETLLYSLKSSDLPTLPRKSIISSELINVSNEKFTKQRFQFVLSIRPTSSIYCNLHCLFLLTTVLFLVTSYIFIVQPSFDTPKNELWENDVTFVADDKNSYIEKTEDGLYYFHMDIPSNPVCIEVPEEDIDNGYYEDYPFKYTENIDHINYSK